MIDFSTRQTTFPTKTLLLGLVLTLGLFASALGQTSRVQIIHNAAAPGAASVDVYLNEDLTLDDFAFRSATPFVDFPAGIEVNIGIAGPNSTSSADAIAVFPVTLEADETYTVIANGVLDPTGFASNPDNRETAFTLLVKQMSRETSSDAASVEFFALHGATDAPTVDVVARGVGTLVSAAAYSDITDYVAVPPAAYTLDVRPAGDPTIVASFEADLSSLAGGAAAVIASGFLNPAENQNGHAFALLAILPDGTVLTLPASTTTATSRVQIIHNAADPGAASVDVYLDEALTLDDFAFRTATPFIDFPAGTEVAIGVAGPTSSSSAEAIAVFPVTLEAGATYTVIANGVLDPNTYAANPDGRETAFTLLVKQMAREASRDASSVDFFALHGATDAPTVDVVARGVGTLVGGAAYSDITDYITVPPAAYTLDLRPAGDPTIVASFNADLSGLAGGAAAVIASGFLDSASNQNGPAFALLAVLPDGTVLTLPASTTPATSRVQIIHNAADPSAASVDVYVDEELTLDDFAFRTATPFIDFQAGTEVNIGIAGPNSTSLADVIAVFPVTLEAGETYTVIANGVLEPSSFAANPDNRETAFTLLVKAGTREAATDSTMVDFFVLHGATDAPSVDVIAKGVATLAPAAAYGDLTDYLSVPPAFYVVDITLPGGVPIVASFAADLSGLTGGAAAILASGFLTPGDNQNGPAFSILAVLPDGTAIELPVVTSTEDQAEIPVRFGIQGNYPNPFNPTTNITFDLPESAAVSVAVFDMLGRRVLGTPAAEYRAGTGQEIRLDAGSLPSGSYVYQLVAETSNDRLVGTGRMLLMK